ncbi:hypothetical protein [uncultured Tenacibaculum sp.]|uniref:hypothetical protein n=1 Tax=uncultured Tenacibaculum sp. TaxID=174713 RepID=UPI0026096DBD|nr:hypothetical protein [uncultured Tenacibaculum sp.]
MKFLRFTFLLLLGVVFITSCKTEKKEIKKVEKEVEAYAKSEINELWCKAESSWFTIDSNTGKRKTPPPAEDKSSVFGNNKTVSNCDFHQWSWQKFLWLTNDIDGKPLFIKELTQVTNQNVPVTQPSGQYKIILTSHDNVQATGDILKSNKTFSKDNKSYDVYYSIHVNDTLYNNIEKYAKMEATKYTDTTFPVGSLELKVAWVDAKAISDTSSYFVTDAVIDGEDTQIALLGMHVVGVVYNHPEFIWATFEHDDLVPYYDWKATTDADVPVTSSTNKLFFDKNATGTIDNLASHYNDPSKDNPNVFAVNKYGVPRQAQNSFLATSQDGKTNYDNIDKINKSVKSQLKDIWVNYFYNGSIWIDTEGYKYPTEQAKLLNTLGGDLSNSAPGKLTRGSVAAYNITMETYEQLGFNPPKSIHEQSVTTMGNCFSCHSSNGTSGSPLNVSHIFNGAVSREKGHTRKETKQKHLNEVLNIVKKMK